MNKHIGVIAALLISGMALANEQTDCAAGKGVLLTGAVVGKASFAKAVKDIDGIGLSHTHVNLRVDGGKGMYDVAMDDVFASDFVEAATTGPASLMALKDGDRIEVCGQPYPPGQKKGIHWVHTDCGQVPTPQSPNGWVKRLGAGNDVGPNLESTMTYCHLWNKKS